MFGTLFRRRVNAPSADDAGKAYAYKASLIGAAHRFELTDGGLVWRTGRRSGLWAYTDIRSVRLSYRPMGMQHRRFRADLAHDSGCRITIFSTSKQSVALMEPQAGYAAFLLRLHDRLAQTGSPASLCAGLRTGVYRVIVAAVALLALAMAALGVRALWTGELAGLAFIVMFSGLFAWQIGGFLRRNRPRRYNVNNVPLELLGSGPHH